MPPSLRDDPSMAPPTSGRAVVLLSGGLDSATCLAIARSEGRECHCLSYFYGQRHRVELDAARRVAAGLGAASHRIIEIDPAAFGGSALTDPALEVPKEGSARGDPGLGSRASPDRPSAKLQAPSRIPITYVPARNTIFISYALAAAEVSGAGWIYLGVNAVDYSGYPDCRPEYVEAFQRLADLATRAGVEGRGPRIAAPLMHLTKAQIIRRGLGLGVDYGLTTSCYDPVERAGRAIACGGCESCRIRAGAFAEVGVRDPSPSAA